MSQDKWMPCAEEMPDSDATVMTFAPGSDCLVWPGYHNGERWMNVDETPMGGPQPTHWMDFPEPPQ